MRALLFLDVDGPLIPFGPKPSGCRRAPVNAPDAGNPLLARLDPGDGCGLTAADFSAIAAWLADGHRPG